MAGARPGELPGPSDDLATLSLPLVDIGSLWFRCHRRRRPAVYFGRKMLGRFDDPQKRFGVLYAGLDPRAAFIEVFGGFNPIDREELDQREISSLVASRSVVGVDLTGSHLARIGLDARVFAGDHGITRRWSRAFHEHPDRPDGVLYRCRHDPSQVAVAIYERAALTFEVTPLGDATLTALAASYGLAVE